MAHVYSTKHCCLWITSPGSHKTNGCVIDHSTDRLTTERTRPGPPLRIIADALSCCGRNPLECISFSASTKGWYREGVMALQSLSSLRSTDRIWEIPDFLPWPWGPTVLHTSSLVCLSLHGSTGDKAWVRCSLLLWHHLDSSYYATMLPPCPSRSCFDLGSFDLGRKREKKDRKKRKEGWL